jgi:mannosyltransferase
METAVSTLRGTLFAAAMVFMIAVILRVPSCYESFWLDELHSAWCVWDSLFDVFKRANLGHQSPFYFVGLWFWKQVVGSGEVALRLSSVIAVAAGSAVLTISVARWTKSLVAGATTGMIIAVESNSLFFGTELRPYAFVILLTCIAIAYLLRLTAVASRTEDGAAWIGLIVAILLAMLCQPATIGVLAWLPCALLVVWLIRDHRRALTFSLADGLLVLSAAAVGFALWRVTLGDSWHQRSMWASFAMATHIDQIWEVWDWTWLLVVPLCVILGTHLVVRRGGGRPPLRDLSIVTLVLAAIAVLATSLFWFVSWMNWVPVWHRRYFIAVLPVLACLSGGAVGIVDAAVPTCRRYRLAGLLAAIAMVLALATIQGTLTRLPDYPVALVTRGEDWRAAVDWVRRNVLPNDLVFLDAGLIEASAVLGPMQNQAGAQPSTLTPMDQLNYLNFAVSGPYQVRYEVIPISRGRVTRSQISNRRLFVITRRPAHLANVSGATGSSVFGFGNVSVTVIDENSRKP